MQGLQLPIIKKEFALKTDASNVGFGAVSMQKKNGIFLPIKWESKKLSLINSRY